MPNLGSSDPDYQMILDEVNELMKKFQPFNTIIWLGDINGSFKREKSNGKDRLMKAFLQKVWLQLATRKFTNSHLPPF